VWLEFNSINADGGFVRVYREPWSESTMLAKPLQAVQNPLLSRMPEAGLIQLVAVTLPPSRSGGMTFANRPPQQFSSIPFRRQRGGASVNARL